MLSLDQEKLIEQAQEEGGLTLCVPDQAAQWERAVLPFEKKYNIDVSVEEVPEAELTGRIQQKTEESTVDAMITRGSSTQELVEEKLLLGPIEPVLFDKQTNTSLRQDGVNSVGCLVPVSRYQTGILYDSTKTCIEDWESAAQYLEDGMLTVPDPNTSMAGRALLQSVVLNLDDSDTDYSDVSLVQEIKTVNWQSGFSWLSEHLESFAWAKDDAAAIKSVREGRSALTAARSDLVGQTGAASGDIKFYVPEFQMAEGSESIGISLSTGHPAASLLLVNWLVTLEGQQALYDARRTIPLCEGVLDDRGAPVSAEMDANSTEFLPSFYQGYLLQKLEVIMTGAEKQDSEQQTKEQDP